MQVSFACNRIETGGIHDVGAGRVRYMIASGAVALFATDIPFGHGLVLNVVVDRMAAVAERTGGPLHVVRRIKRSPPVGPVLHEVGSPDLIA